MFKISEKEREILDFWKRNQVFKKSLQKRKGAKRFIFYEGPPYANGKPGIHHALARSFKDIVLRYKTMKGFYVERKAGWDTHGLPAEIAAEKVLGIKTKKDIEKIGVEKFIQICKENVFTHKKEWDDFTEKLGYWLDLENPYITCSNEYIESLFFVIKKFYERGYFYKEKKVVPWCPRCQTTLASHELAQGYQKIKENSIYVKLKIKDQKEFSREILKSKTKVKNYLLIWTTTPWTLPGNVAVAFNPKIKYVLVRNKEKKENYILAKERLENIFGSENYEILKELKKEDILNLKYEPLFKQKIDPQYKERIWRVYPADFVSTEEGSGFVHIAPAFGEEDFNLGKEYNLLPILTVDESGKVIEGIVGEGKFVKEADKDIIADLKKRNLLLKEELYEHDYPFCWRCDSPILYYLHSSWFVANTKVKDKLLKNNKKINWYPYFIKDGRFGNFLEEVRDWNFSRERYWGTPIPVWECENCKNIEVIGSRKDLFSQKFSSNRYFLLRHGLAETNIRKILNSSPEKNYGLTKEGKKQIRMAGEKLKKLLKNQKIDLIFSSDLPRCKETAKIIKEEIGFEGKIIFSKKLRDIKLGEWEGKNLEDFKKEFLTDPKKYIFEGPKGGESWNDFKKRMLSFVEDIEKKYQNKNILIVSHGDPLWALFGAFQGWDTKETIEAIKRGKGHFKKGELREVEYKKFPFDEDGNLDFHRPFIDKVIFWCKKCNGKMRRVKEVCDVWFDSGAMPFAQTKEFFEKNIDNKSKKLFPPQFFPADFICEGIDQTRGWFYTLLSVSTLLGFESSFKNVLVIGLVMDKFGKKMSKSRGNVVDPWEMMQKYGADSLRWYFYTINQPWESKNFNEDDLKKCFNRFILTLYNCLVFYETYAKKKVLNSFIKNKNPLKPQKVIDKWILSSLSSLILKVEKLLENYDIVFAAREIENFVVENLSNWYIRRSRERFQKPKSKKDLEEASIVLGYVLLEVSKLLAPFVPFLSEIIYKKVSLKENSSVHLEDYPKSKKEFISKALEKKMEKVREVVSLALAKRKEASLKVRQPLALLKIKEKEFKNLKEKELLDLIKEEVNVKKVVLDKNIKTQVELDTKITKELKEEGILREIIRKIQEARKNLGLTKDDIIKIYFDGEKDILEIFEKYKKTIKKETLAKEALKNNLSKIKNKEEIIFDEGRLYLLIKK